MKPSSAPPIAAEVIDAAQRLLARVIAPVEGVRLALLCTPDGFEITALRQQSELPTERLSAMASSLMAMAKAVVAEIGHDSCKRLTFETGMGTVVFQAVEGAVPCVLCLVLDQKAVLGRALWAAAEVGAGLPVR